MRRATLTFVALLGLGVVPLTAVPALAEYGAIAWDKETGKVGSSWNQTTAQRAAEAAFSECGATGCKVVIQPGPQEVRRTGDDRKTAKYAGGAARKDRDAARLAALANCTKGKAGECTVRVTDCNK